MTMYSFLHDFIGKVSTLETKTVNRSEIEIKTYIKIFNMYVKHLTTKQRSKFTNTISNIRFGLGSALHKLYNSKSYKKLVDKQVQIDIYEALLKDLKR